MFLLKLFIILVITATISLISQDLKLLVLFMNSIEFLVVNFKAKKSVSIHILIFI